MSKVKCADGCTTHEKAKLRVNLRRKENAHIKNRRKSNAKSDVYAFGKGYYIKDERKEGKTVLKEIPACDVVVKWEKIEKEGVYIDKHGKTKYDTYTVLKPIYAHCDARVVKRRIFKGYTPIKPYLRRINIRKKWYKKQANKNVRNSNESLLLKGNDYKRFYDVAWEII